MFGELKHFPHNYLYFLLKASKNSCYGKNRQSNHQKNVIKENIQ